MPDNEGQFIFTADDGRRFRITGPPGATLDHAQDKLKQLQGRFPDLTGRIERRPQDQPTAGLGERGQAALAGIASGLGGELVGTSELSLMDPLTPASSREKIRRTIAGEKAQLAELRKGHEGDYAFDIPETAAKIATVVGPHSVGHKVAGAIEAGGKLGRLGADIIGHGLAGGVSGFFKPTKGEDVAGEKLKAATLDSITDALTAPLAGAAGDIIKGGERVVKSAGRKMFPSVGDIIPIGDQSAKQAARAAIGGAETAGATAAEVGAGEEGGEKSFVQGIYDKAKGTLTIKNIKPHVGEAVERTAESIFPPAEGAEARRAPRQQPESLPFTTAEAAKVRQILKGADHRALVALSQMPPDAMRDLLRYSVLQQARPPRSEKYQPPPMPQRGQPVVTPIDDPLSRSTPGLGLGLMPAGDQLDPFEAAGQYLGELSGFRGP